MSHSITRPISLYLVSLFSTYVIANEFEQSNTLVEIVATRGRYVHGNGIPDENGNPTGFQWKWDKKCRKSWEWKWHWE